MNSARWISWSVFAHLALALLPCSAAESLVLVAGGGTNTAARTRATAAKLQAPFGVDFDAAGHLYLVEMTGQRVRRLTPEGDLSVIAGTGEKGPAGDGGPAMAAQFNGPHNLAVSARGDLFIADTWNNRVRKISAPTPEGPWAVTSVAGTGEKGFSGDGDAAVEAKFGGIYCVSLDPSGQRLLLTDLDQLRVRELDLASGKVRTVAGNGRKGVPPEGALAVEAPLVDPRAAIHDAGGRVYVLERGGHALRVVGQDGKIRTVAGTGQKGFSGDGGDALSSTLNGPKHLCLDREGNILIADTENHVIRKYLPREGKIVRVAGTGRKGAKGLDGPPLEAELNQPHGVHVHRDGTLYIADSSNHRVLKIVSGTR